MARTSPITLDAVTFRYDLHELPTAQHKAGLAGLLLQIDSMNERLAAGALPGEVEAPVVEEVSAGSARVRFTAKSTQDLLDDLYGAEIVEVRRTIRRKGGPPKREEPIPNPRPGGPKRRFYYDDVQPFGAFLRRFTDDGKEHWHKLWRDMLWAIPRGSPPTRGPYNQRARGESTTEGPTTWRALVSHHQAVTRGAVQRVKIAGPDMLGAQATDAECVPFEDRADHGLLLQFWPLTVRVFVPEIIDADGDSKIPPNEYVLAVPEVSDLVAFNRAYARLLGELTPQRRGYRPAESIISLPAQGSLEFIRQLADLAQRRVITERPGRYIAAVEYFHMAKPGKTVKVTARGRVPPRDTLLERYAGIRGAFRNPIFQAASLVAALGDRAWYSDFGAPLAERGWWLFVHSTHEAHRTKPAMVGFAWEAARRFQQIEKNYTLLKEAGMVEVDDAPDSVDALIYSLVGKYVRALACEKAGVKEDDAKWWMKTAEERRDVCAKLFLELRSRDGDDFVRHFTATFGSVPQWLDEQKYLVVASALMRTFAEDLGENRLRTRDDVKTLTLLALSAHSRSLQSRREPANDLTPTQEEQE
jgi:CRISPR-associated protein Cmx8